MNSLQLTLYRDAEIARSNAANEELKAQANALQSQYNAEIKRNNEILADIRSRELELESTKVQNAHQEALIGLGIKAADTAYGKAASEAKYLNPFIQTASTLVGTGLGAMLGSPQLGALAGSTVGMVLSRATASDRANEIATKAKALGEDFAVGLGDIKHVIEKAPEFENAGFSRVTANQVDW